MEKTIKVHCVFNKMVPIDEIKLFPKNANKHPKEQIKRLAEIIAYQGIRLPIIISSLSGFVIAGEGRYLAYKKLGLKEVPCDIQEFENEDVEYAFMVSDNAISSWAELDLSLINSEIPNLGPDMDIDMLGIKNFTIEPAEKAGLTDPDSIPEVTETRAKRGDVWILGSHRLLCGDSTVITDVEKLMNGEKAMLWSSDPPYGISYVKNQESKGFSAGYKNIENDDKQDEELKEFIYSVITSSLPFMEKGFAFYMWHAMKMQAYFSQAAAAAAAAAGILFHRQIIWVKPQFVFGRGHYHWRHELCLMGWLHGNEPPFYGEKNQSTVWEVKKENDKIHPTQKPIQLFEIPILNHTKANEIIYEPFSGSGSNFVACEKNNRRCYGIEIDPHYCDIIIKRWEDFTGKVATISQPVV